MNRPPQIRYQPSILGRFPVENYPGYELPQSVPLFCMPMGAAIECWPKKCQQPRPVFSTFVLTSDTNIKVFGAAICFYEIFDDGKLTSYEKECLEYTNDTTNKQVYAMKSLCILSRWPFFDTFEKFLFFLYKMSMKSQVEPLNIPLEKFISHFMMEVPFPSSSRPNVAYQLSSTSNEELKLSQPPEDMPLPLSGASFSQMLRNLGPENCLHVLVLALTEQKILLHSLRADVLTSVAESITSIIFPFVWECPYIPLCPLGLYEYLNAPVPFIIGVDSRYFDTFIPPPDVVCVDLDTNSIYLSEFKRKLTSSLLPKKAAKVLSDSLHKLHQKLSHPSIITSSNNCKSSVYSNADQIKKFERQVDLEIQESFLHFMSSILRGFRSHLRPITSAPTSRATDPESLFDLQGFIRSRDRNHHQFYLILMKTQMFTRFIEERSFVSDKDSCLAFFDECLDKIEKTGDFDRSRGTRLIDVDYIKSDRTVFIPAPEPNGDGKLYVYKTIDKLDTELFHSVPTMKKRESILSWQNLEAISPSKSTRTSLRPQSPLGRRTKQEIRQALRIARKHHESPFRWAKCLVSYVYSLWFVHLPSYIRKSEFLPINAQPRVTSLRLAIQVLARLQSLDLQPIDETCYRLLLLLCGEYHQPILAVKVFCEMKQYGVIPNAITYGYYNKAVLESPWPTGETSATFLWSKLRNVIIGVGAFKRSSRSRVKCRKSLPFDGVDDTDVFDTVDKSISDSVSDDISQNEWKDKEENKDKIINGSLDESKYSIDFTESDIFREKFGRIVRATSVALPYVHDTHSSAGLLMSTNISDDVFVSPTKIIIRKRDRSRIVTESNEFYETSPPDTLRKEFLRSYSFGNDSRIIQNLQQGPLEELKHELERNHQIVPENELVSEVEKVIQEDICEEDEDENEVNKVTNNDHDKIDENNQSKTSSKQNLSSSLRKFSAHAIKTYRSSSVDGWLKDRSKTATGSMSPIKDAVSSIFSPEGKLASIANKLATKITETSNPKDLIARSLGESIDTPTSREQLKTNNGCNITRPESGMSRSATLPPDVEGRVALDCSSSTINDSLFLANLSQGPYELDQSDLNTSQQSTADSKSKSSTTSSPWPKSLQGKHVDYLNQTLKSAANSMASRISEIRTNLSVNSPAKLSSSSGSFFSQIMMKLPNNFNGDDDSSSINSSDRRLSEDDISEVDSSRNPRATDAIKSMVKIVESHYNQRLAEVSSETSIIIEMTSCSRCYKCSSFAFDEEIMANWTPDESNLNTQCQYCARKFVPLLTIEVRDASSHGHSSSSSSADRNTSHRKESLNESINCNEPFTVPYLSPLVLRKEVENVLEHESDACLLSADFIDHHPIIYWNLIWYFERVNLPSHLPGLILQCNSILPDGNIPSEHDHRNVKVICRYDNERLHLDSCNIRPLYKRWLELSKLFHLILVGSTNFFSN